MQLHINAEGYIDGYAIMGGFLDGIEIADDFLGTIDLDKLNYYRYVDGEAILDEAKYLSSVEEELSSTRAEKQSLNNTLLAKHLASHPLKWTDNKLYGVTQEDQQEIALNLTQYQLYSAAGIPATLQWHAVHEECRDFTQEELIGLTMAITAYVYPLIHKNQAYKAQIYAATTTEELEAIELTYDEEVI